MNEIIMKGKGDSLDEIKHSSIYLDDLGRLILITQGLIGYTLVSNKKILFRLFLDLSAANRVSSAVATITYELSTFSVSKSFVIPTNSLLRENSTPNGPSIGIILTGDVIPYPSTSFISYNFTS